MINQVVVEGRLSRPPSERELPSGTRLLSLELTVPREPLEKGPAETMPVAWFDAPAAACSWEVDTEVLVVGRVRRRFFHAGGATQSRTEVVAEKVTPKPAKARRQRLLHEVATRLEDAASGA